MPAKIVKKTDGIAELIAKWQESEILSDGLAAAKLGISRQLLNEWRTGHCAPSRNKWALIADRTGCTIEAVAIAIAQGVKP